MKKLINAYDKFQKHDSLGGFCGELIFGKNKHVVPFTDPFGKQSYRTEFDQVLYKDHNIVTIGGYQFAFDKLFNIGLDQESTLRVGDLNDEAPQMKIGVNRGNYQSIYYNAEVSTTDNTLTKNAGINISGLNYIFGFMIGDGAAREDNITAIAPDYKDRTLYRAVPFRVTNDTASVNLGKYYGRITALQDITSVVPITSYYIKKFDEPSPHIVHSWVTDNGTEGKTVNDTVFSSNSSLAIESYVELNLSVSEEDGREWFTANDATPRINEFALVSGWYNKEKDDYEQCRIFSHFTRPSILLSDGDSIECVYRIYAR